MGDQVWKKIFYGIPNILSLYKKCFTLRTSSVNVTKYAKKCGFGHIY